MDDIKIEFGELYVLKKDSEYWIVNIQRMMKFTDDNPIVVKLEHSFCNKLFFGHLQNEASQNEIEIEFSISDIVEKYDIKKYKEEEELKRFNLIFPTYDLLGNIQNV